MKTKYRPSYGLPDGKSTYSTRRYIREWKALYGPVAKALNATVVAFDPDIRFKTQDYMSFTLPVPVVQRIKTLLDGGEWRKRAEKKCDLYGKLLKCYWNT